MALIAIGRISKQIVHRCPVFFVKQDVVALFMAYYASLASRRISMARNAVGGIFTAGCPTSTMRAGRRLGMAGCTRILFMAYLTARPVPSGKNTMRSRAKQGVVINRLHDTMTLPA